MMAAAWEYTAAILYQCYLFMEKFTEIKVDILRKIVILISDKRSNWRLY